MISSQPIQKVESDHTSIKIDLTMVDAKFKKNEIYKNEKLGVKEIKKNTYNGENGKNEKFVANISVKDHFSYVGTLNQNLQRNGIGIFKYKCEDTYFGHWKGDRKDEIGIYAHKPENDQSEFYAGQWAEATRNGFGIYVWRKDNQPKNNAIMDVFIGDFDQGNLSKGLYVSIQPEGEKVMSYYYFGKFVNGKKFDGNALYYLGCSDTLFQGQIDDVNLVKGKIYQGIEGRAFRFEKENNEYLPDEISEEEEKEVKKFYEAFKNFDKSENIIKVHTGLVEKIDELIKKYSDIGKFTDKIDLSNELDMNYYKNIFTKFNQLASPITDSNVKLQEPAQPNRSNNSIDTNNTANSSNKLMSSNNQNNNTNSTQQNQIDITSSKSVSKEDINKSKAMSQPNEEAKSKSEKSEEEKKKEHEEKEIKDKQQVKVDLPISQNNLPQKTEEDEADVKVQEQAQNNNSQITSATNTIKLDKNAKKRLAKKSTLNNQ
jgi:hypothetical protein